MSAAPGMAAGAAARRRAAIARQARIWGGVFVCALFLFPIFWMVMTSFKMPRDIFTTPPKLIFTPTIETYVSYIWHAEVPRRMLNTVIVAFGAGAISIVAGAMAGYALARLPLRGASTIGTIILLSRGVPPLALAVPMFLVARKLGLSDKHITLILAYCTFLIPYVMWLMRGFFKALPPELEESAMLDGCSRFGAFWGSAYSGRVGYVIGFTGLGVGASRFGADTLLDGLFKEKTDRTALKMVRSKPLPFPPEPARQLVIDMTRRSLAKADERSGERDLWLRTLDRLGLGFDS